MNSLLTALQRHSLGDAEKVAIRSGDNSLSYAGLLVAVEQTRSRLRACRVKSLGVYLDNGIDWIVADLAALAAEIRVVPLPWFFSDEQIGHALADGAVDFVVHGGHLPFGVVGTGSPLKLGEASWIQPIASADCVAVVSPRTAGKLSYTSGTTGRPKGIDLPYDFIDQTCRSIGAAISGLGIETHLSILPYPTLLENIAGVYVPLMLGKTVCAEPAADIGLTAELGLDPGRLRQTFNRIEPDSLILTPQLLEVFCLLAEADAIDPACLAFVAVGGARVGETLMRRARRAGIPAYEGYGLTEFGSVAILNTPRSDRVGSVGKPLPGVSVALAADGEICLSTRLTQNDAEQGQGQSIEVKTGDYGSIDDDGFVYVHGRKTNLIVLSSGRNVSPEWVETELNSSSLIAQSCVFSETGSELSALLVATAAGIPDSDLVGEIERVNLTLPAYARITNWHRMPHVFSQDNHMLTANGRLRRLHIQQALPRLLASSGTYPPLHGGDSSQFSAQEINP